jgi:hypothetical protein
MGIIVISKITNGTMAERIKKQSSHSSIFGWVIPSGANLASLTTEYGINMNFIQPSTDTTNGDVNSLMITVTRPAVLQSIPSPKLPRIIYLNSCAVKGKLAYSYSSPIEGSEEAQCEFFKLALQLLKNQVAGVIFGDWIDAGLDQPNLEQNTGILTSERLTKAGYYYLYHNLR